MTECIDWRQTSITNANKLKAHTRQRLENFKDLKLKHGKGTAGATFNRSHGWFHGFQAYAKLHNYKVTVEAVSADTVGTIEFPKTMAEIIKNEDYVPQQIFSVDESELWWKKKMSDRC